MIKANNLASAFVFLIVIIASIFLVSANTYITDIYFTISDSIFITNERIELKGAVYQANYSNNGTLVTSSSSLANAIVNLTIRNSTGANVSTYNFTTDSTGAFYSGSNFYPNATNITSPSTEGLYKIRAQYRDANNNISFSEVEINVVNKSLDILSISSDKAIYNPSETMTAEIEAVKSIGDQIIYISNVSINGSLRNSTNSILQSFNCTTGSNGKCSVSLTAPSTYGNYILEIDNFKTYSAFSVVPFSYTLYMKDELNSFKNVFALGEKSKVEVRINNASSSDSYTFSGYIADSAGNSVKTISSTSLSSTNSFTNTFLFTVDAITFSYGSYVVYVTVTKSGDGSISATTSFQVQDWILAVDKKTSDSGFEYKYSTFPNKTLRFGAIPSFRSNGSVIENITGGSFNVSLKDGLNNILTSTNATWNLSCGKSGCYEFSLSSPATAGKYFLYTTLSHSGDTQTDSKVVNVVSGVLSAQTTDKDGNIKELFGTNEYAYLSLSSYNLTSPSFNLSDAEVFLVTYMNGTESNYTNVSYNLVNASNTANEWGWNSTSQRIKLDVPKAGGVYNVFIFGNNRTLGTETRFIVNPYDTCIASKNAPSNASGSSGYYYIWQFKTSDTIYFEIKLTQANNPLGRASAVNGTNSSTYGMGSACSIDTTTKQVVSNATISVVEVRNLESGGAQTLNSSETSCQASDTSGGYTCTVKPNSKWDGGVNIAKFKVVGQDGTSSVFYSNFETRAFYLYGWSNNWQNGPSDNLTLNVRLYEAGSSWWSTSGSSGGISGTITIKRVEYMGSDGEWVWPPVESNYNVSNLSSASVTSGTGSISLPASLAKNGKWKSGYYRVVLQATTSSGDSDYGYAWFAIKLWDVYGSPIECLAYGCNYKNYFNSKENITLYITINKASNSYNYNSYSQGNDIYGNVTVAIKKIQQCISWPCKELNSSQYVANTINVNASSPWYWSANINNQSKYIIQINKTTGGWSSGWYSVVLNVNGTDTGYAWFNAIAFYVDAQPSNSTGAGYKYTIRGNQAMHFNVTTTKNYKYSYWNGSDYLRYNESDFVNVTLDTATLRTWDSQTYRSKEFLYLTDFNISKNSLNGSTLINLTYNNGSWPTGYYWGELTLKNSDNETSSGWLWFNVQPFRISIIANNSNIDSDQCVKNASLSIYDSDWSSNTPLVGNYSILGVYENIWSYSGNSITYYPNFTINDNANSTSFNATSNVTFCPNNGLWSSGSWGGYHYLNIIVKDNNYNDTQTGWLSFRTVPFTISWNPSSFGSKRTTANINSTATLTKPSGASVTGNLTKVYQYRYENYQSTKEEYRFVVNGSGYYCDSNSAGQCVVNGTANVTIYAPSGGWRIGYNYLQADWAKEDNSAVSVQDWTGLYFEGRETYNGYFSNVDSNGAWKYYFSPTENITIRLAIRDENYNAVASLSISSVQYSGTQNCWTESCKSYTSATWSVVEGGTSTNANGYATLNIAAPSGGWTKGEYYIKATAGGVTVTGGNVRVKDFAAPNVTISVPVNNATYNTSLSFSATTTENAQCSFNINHYDQFYTWYCGAWNSTNGTTTTQTRNACNTTKYGYNGSTYRMDSVSNGYHSFYDGENWSSCYSSSGSTYCYGPASSRLTTYISTGGTSHTYTFNLTALADQHYGASVWCYDEDYNYATELAAFKVNNTGT